MTVVEDVLRLDSRSTRRVLDHHDASLYRPIELRRVRWRQLSLNPVLQAQILKRALKFGSAIAPQDRDLTIRPGVTQEFLKRTYRIALPT